MPTGRCRTWLGRLLALLTVAIGSAFWSAPAFAHATLERTSPAPGQELAHAPREVVLDFDEAVTLGPLGTVTVRDPTGDPVQRGAAYLRRGGAEVAVHLRPDLPDGLYLVAYRVVSDDGHPVSGGFGFRVGATSPNVAALGTTGGTGRVNTGAGPAVRVGFAAARFAGLSGLLLLVGGTLFVAVLWPRGFHLRRPKQFIWIGYGLTLAGSVVELALEAPYAGGRGAADFTGGSAVEVLGSPFGVAHLVRLGLLVAGAPVVAVMLSDRGRALMRAMAVGGGIALVLTWPFSGHPAADRPALFVPIDALHVAATCVWIGGLVLLVGALLPRADAATLRHVLPRWSSLAMASVAVIAVTGVLQALLEMGHWGELATTSYGRLVLAKVALLSVVLAVANSSRMWVRRHITLPVAYAATDAYLHRVSVKRADVPERSRLRRSVLAEILIAAVTIGVASVLVQTPPPGAQAADTGAQRSTTNGPFAASVQRGDVVMQLVVAPARRGTDLISVALANGGGSAVPVTRWQVDAIAPTGRRLPVPMATLTGHGFGEIRLPTSGVWTFAVTAYRPAGRTTALREKVPVR